MAAAVPPIADDEEMALAMLRALAGEKEDPVYAVLFQLDPARSTSFFDLRRAAAYAAGQPDVWLHMGLTRRRFAGGARPKAAEIDGLCGLGADIDIAGPAHKKDGLPPTIEAARAIVDAIGLPCGLLVHSGHGLQPWWPWRGGPWMFDDEAERRRAQILLRAFGLTVRERARQLGYQIDMTFDLPRLFRLAGTLNAKLDPVPVAILEATGATITEEDVLAILLDGTWEQAEREIDGRRGSGGDVVYGDVILDPNAEPPFDRFGDLCDLEPKFRASWNHKRKDLDGTPSGYDFSLAQYAVKAGWSDQEIADLIIACRRRHGDDLKLRQDYFALTIGKARQRYSSEIQTARLLDDLEEAQHVQQQAQAQAAPSAAPPAKDPLVIVSELLGVTVTRFVQYKADPPHYRLETELGAIALGEASAVLSKERFRAAIFAATRRVIPIFKNKDWGRVVQALGDACVVESTGDESTDEGIARAWVTTYVAKHPPTDDVAESVTANLAFVKDGHVCVWTDRLQQFLAHSYFDKVTPRQMGAALRVFGAAPVKVMVPSAKTKSGRTSRNAWQLPEGWQDAQEHSEP
jgi:hypothetical protein